MKSFSLVWLLGWALVLTARPVTSSCNMDDDVCEFWLEISHKMTMMNGRNAVFPENGRLYEYDTVNTTATDPVNPEDVVVADGWETQRLVVTANGTMPGPPIEVWEDQMVIVHVRNLMTSASVTIHWHGLHQVGTPWMDGVAFVTQCPILPYQTFSYRFKAAPKGTFWYHSHIGTQLSMGLVGAFIIRPKVPPPMEERILMLMDWNHAIDADLMHMRMVYGNFENRKKLQSTGSLEGGHFSMFPFHAGLINGRGRFYNEDGTHTGAPLTRFLVKQNEDYRFRVIGSGSLYPFRVSIDDHPMTIVATDGYDLQPMTVESFIINPGERYDVVIHANQTVKTYWIRAQTLEINVENHHAEAILEYEGSPEMQEPTTSRKACSENDRCIVANCPFLYFPMDDYTDCVPITDFRSDIDHHTPGADESAPEEIEEVFLNFAFPGTTSTPGSVNGRAFVHPPVSPLTQPQQLVDSCDPSQCGEQKICHCPYTLHLEHNKVYQFVLLNMGNGKGWPHPIHMHGHSFYLLKTGYPEYNMTTGALMGDMTNSEVNCRGGVPPSQSFCNNAAWANASWGGNNVPGLELELPIRKDTVMVPTGGYVVIRFRADNPGLWFMHCHIELHNIDGMALMLNESFSRQAAPPPGFPKCHDFHLDMAPEGPDDSSQHGNNNVVDDDDYDEEVFWVVVGCLIAVVIIQFLALLWCWRRQSHAKGSLSTSETNVYSNNAFNSK